MAENSQVTSSDKPVWPLIAMIIWFAALLIATGALMLLGMAFGSEAYRDRPIPLAELAMIYGPFLATASLMAATVFFWSKDNRRVAFAAWGTSVALLVAGGSYLGVVI